MRKSKGKENLEDIVILRPISKEKAEESSPFCKKLTLFEPEACES